MNVTIDLAADAAMMVWGQRARGRSVVVDVPGKGVRLLLNDAGDVVGVEVLGWTERAGAPAEVALHVDGATAADVLAEDDPLALALSTAATDVAPTGAGRPLDEQGQPMISVREASELTGKERSWLTRQLNAGKLRGRKVGSEWWTTSAWCEDYTRGRRPATASA